MKKPISIKCGVGTCDHYNKYSISKCGIYDDRKKCSHSMKRLRKNRNHSRRNNKEFADSGRAWLSY